jgi:hypothetical protein
MRIIVSPPAACILLHFKGCGSRLVLVPLRFNGVPFHHGAEGETSQIATMASIFHLISRPCQGISPAQYKTERDLWRMMEDIGKSG